MSAKSNQTGYVRIWNTTPGIGVPREALLLLGVSTKRGDDATIGRFGSGIKFAPISALRKGYEFIVACSDTKGPYRFHMEEVEGSKFGEIEFVFDDGTRRASSFTTGAGEVSWDQDFQILREAIANARDAVTENRGLKWGWEYADTLNPDPNRFEVWITASEGVRKVMDSFEEYFAFDRKKAMTFGYRSLYPKAHVTPLKAFCHGVLVHENIMNSLFDVESRDFSLSEERTLKNEWELADAVKTCLRYASSEDVVNTVLKHVRDSRLQSVFELSQSVADRFWSMGDIPEDSIWLKGMSNVFPEKTVFMDPNQANLRVSLSVRGYNPVLVNEHIKKILSCLGCPTAEQAIKEINDRDRIIDWDWMNYPILDEAMVRVTAVMPELSERITSLGVWDTNDEILGVAATIDGEKKILITKQHAEHGTLTDIMATLVHECDHITTGVGDGDEEGRLFREVADNHIGKLINRIYNMMHKEN